MTSYSEEWSIQKTVDRGYLGIYKVKRRSQNRLQTGYFKYIKPRKHRYIGPLLGNELLAYRLGRLIGLPVAQIELTSINGTVGILSFARAGHRVYRWKELQKKHSRSLQRYVINPERLQKTFVFDAWICNIDRSGKNVLLYRSQNNYDFYLIDHELCLLGALKFENRSWHSRYWDNIRAYTRGYHPVLTRTVHNYQDISAYVEEIQGISQEMIAQVVNSVPSALLSSHQKRVIIKLLLRRQKRLPYILQRYLQHRH